MAKSSRNSGLAIGAIFTTISLLLTLTFLVPIFSVVPGAVVESVVTKNVNNNFNNRIGKITILILFTTFLLILIGCFYGIRRSVIRDGQISKRRISFLMLVLYFPVHSLGFYLYWGICLGFRGDGQLMFEATSSFPISSFAFLLIGFFFNMIKNFAIKKTLVNRIELS